MSRRARPFLIELGPGEEMPGHFFREKCEELGFLLSGELEMQLGNDTVQVRAGALIHLDLELPQRWRNPSTEPARLFWTLLSS